jgi:hypothetical protein
MDSSYFVLFNHLAIWWGILAGLICGVVLGLFFHREDWLGGYSAWPRRMIRLGHISFFGIAILNGIYTQQYLWLLHPNDMGPAFVSILLVIAAIAMPAVCFLSAWRRRFRHLFFIPVLSLLIPVGWLAVSLTVYLAHYILKGTP